MTPARRRAALLLALGAAMPAAACELVLREHRGARELARLPLDAAAPQLEIAFTHSVLGTPVVDRYAWRAGRWLLLEERFAGAGYGLPHAAGAGETLTRDGDGWRLELERAVDPLVVRPLPAQRMRVIVGKHAPLLLASLSRDAVELRGEACPDR